MNAKEYLSQAFCIEMQVQSKLEQIEALRSLACRVTAPMGSEPVSHTRNVTSMQDTVGRILEAEEELNKRIDDLVAMKLEIAKTIDRVEDVTLRLILEKRYLAFLSWGQISVDLHYSERWLQVKHIEALEAVEGILGEKTENNPFGSYTDKPDYDKIYNENLRAQKQRKRLTGHEGTS